MMQKKIEIKIEENGEIEIWVARTRPKQGSRESMG